MISMLPKKLISGGKLASFYSERYGRRGYSLVTHMPNIVTRENSKSKLVKLIT